MIKYLSEALLLGLIALPAQAQQISQLTCQGAFMGGRAVVQGQRQYSPYNALGDGYVRFNGSLTTEIGTARMTYEGYTNGAYRGMLQAPQGVFQISVLDATGNAGSEMIIYQGGEHLGAPPTLGTFSCSWR